MNNKFRLNLQTYSSEKIADMIISFRYLKSSFDIQILCMQELARRRTLGEEFNFEDYIDEKLSSLPKIQLNLPKTNFKI